MFTPTKSSPDVDAAYSTDRMVEYLKDVYCVSRRSRDPSSNSGANKWSAKAKIRDDSTVDGDATDALSRTASSFGRSASRTSKSPLRSGGNNIHLQNGGSILSESHPSNSKAFIYIENNHLEKTVVQL